MTGWIIFPLVVCLAGFFAGAPVAADDTRPSPEDRFAAEPKRPKAEKPVRFSESWEMARAEARRSGRRILAYFTGDYCGWCRVMEQRTFTDAEVAALSQRFVCVEVNAGKDENLRLADEFGIDSLPRSLILTAEGKVIDRRTGYIPAAEYAAWLKGAGVKPLAPVGAGGSKPVVPQPVGASESEADLLVWFVDASNSTPRWSDADWTGHPQLIQLLRAAGLHPRIEHMAREDFPARWERAEAAGKVPNLISAERRAGLVRDLSQKNRLVGAMSTRLQYAPENASCPDFAGRWLHLVTGVGNEESGRKATTEILRPGPETWGNIRHRVLANALD